MYHAVMSLHVISVISWMAALLYLPRLYVYHTAAAQGGEADAMLKVMERRLLRYIATPAMMGTFLFGALMLILNPSLLSFPWLHAKLGLVLLLTGTHGVMAAHRRKFETGEGVRGERYYRVLNEIPAVLMAVIVFLVIMKPAFGT
jgi:putative membrane protein